MAKRGPAKTVIGDGFQTMMEKVLRTSRRPKVDAVAFLLSFRAGLRVQEIAGLRWQDHVFGADGDWDMRQMKNDKGRLVSVPFLFVGGDIGKCGRERTLRMHPELHAALKTLWNDPGRDKSDPFVVPSAQRDASQALKPRASALKMRINRMYAEIGVDASSHSGRRSFITSLARMANEVGCSIRDVQKLAGHANLETTESYIEVSDNQSQLIATL